MSAFLEKICAETRDRVAASKKHMPASALRADRKPHDVMGGFDGWNIIAEVKFASPSEGDIHENGDPVAVAAGYLKAGARMLSVLTEPRYFKGHPQYLQSIRAAHPDALLLRKDFMVDEYQLHEAKHWGADAILLIAAMTDDVLTRDLFRQALDMGLTPLVEVHDDAELAFAASLGAKFIGVNNRNLKTLKTDLDTGRRLALKKPKDCIFICESGLATANDVRSMRSAGYDGFLMGTHFMRSRDPGAALQKLMEDLA